MDTSNPKSMRRSALGRAAQQATTRRFGRNGPETPTVGDPSGVDDICGSTAQRVSLSDDDLPVVPPLGKAQRLSLYRTMLSSRRIDDLEIQLNRQNLGFFQISGAGHEATLVAASLVLTPGKDWFFPYYRDRALCLALGLTAHDMLLEAVGAAAGPSSGGRQMPSHWGRRDLNIVSQSSATGTQYLNAVGCAEAGVLGRELPGFGAPHAFVDGEVTYVSSGEGATSQGEFYEALNTACNAKLPVLFHIEDNGYAISVPVEVQTPGGSISRLLSGYPNLLSLEFDGCDLDASYHAWQLAVAYARARRGPVLLHAHVVRLYAHSMSDDERAYRSEEDRLLDASRDPLVRCRRALLDDDGLDDAEIRAAERAVDEELSAARDATLSASPPDKSSVSRYVYSPDIDPTATTFATSPQFSGEAKTTVDLINACLRDEMRRDGRVVVFGQDVADASRQASLSEVKGKGGVFKVTANLQREFGPRRVFNAPLAEANIIGRAIGMAIRGLRPVVEIQFFDYIWTAMMQLRDEMAVLRWRSNNAFSCPVIVRAAYGGYLRGGAVYHSQTGEAIFTHTPGLRVVLPSNALDANGLLRTAIRGDDPVLFLEHKHLYRQTYNRARYPGSEFMIPFGKAATVRAGQDLTVITYGALVKRALDAAARAAKEGIEAEILDLRTLSPYDWETIAASVRRTNKALVVYEDCMSWGSGAEIAARIASDLFEYLDGPVRRIASLDTFVAYHPGLEDAILPQTEDVYRGIVELARY